MKKLGIHYAVPYIIASSLFFGGCGEEDPNREYHEEKRVGWKFSLECLRVGRYTYNSRLELDGGVRKTVTTSVGAPMYSEDPFTVNSLKIYDNEKLNWSLSADKPPWGSFTRQMESLFRSDGGRRSMLISSGREFSYVLEHINECKGKSPCSIPKKK